MVDACEHEQSALLRAYVLSRQAELSELAGAADSAAGPLSISPFVPCAPSRIPYILQAARISAADIVCDLGCGDGAILVEAARRCGCRCLGLDIDAPCLEAARRKAEEAGVAHLCHWARCDLLALPGGALGRGLRELFGGEDVEEPTVAIAFLTAGGLTKLSPWLHGEWRSSAKGLRLVTCVESLDTVVDLLDPAALFTDGNELGWTVCKDSEKWGVFVVPPTGTSLERWREEGGAGWPLQLTRAESEATSPVVLKGLLTDDEVELVDRLGRGLLAEGGAGGDAEALSLFNLPDDAAGFHGAAEDALHSLPQHRVLHLHAAAALWQDGSELPRVERKLVAAAHDHDCWGLLGQRQVGVRSLEYHAYQDGGSVTDPEHRDDGSLVTLSVLLSRRSDFAGGTFATWQGDELVEHSLDRGDGILFVSEKRHNVTRVSGDRRALILELWEGPRNSKNRHS